ncbi:hypothetical protein RhiirA5_458559 [Rhizophagus irregularis]|uniref:Uncharacterized protein n=4 Tax=Rhizophagus irregularis TaxID=588596 RepID=A0A2I1F9M5_9GLOM|nr:hypothetical protein RhiirA5_458559 [Rhizophagus irregularis]PKC57234.1 hypothetical protein RhiirA1_401554 [Rhizophagus irregularis]PKY31079.1 hypothetical protein RhiirB3_488153 [Rhizophagus irregularis]
MFARGLAICQDFVPFGILDHQNFVRDLISNLLIFDIGREQEIYDDKNMLLQFSFQHFYDFNNKFRNDQNDLQLISSQIKDVAYSKELEQEIHNNENMNCDMYFPQLSVQQMYNLNNKFRNGHQLNGISEQLEDFTIDDKE